MLANERLARQLLQRSRVFNESKTEGMLLVDASNVFNELNRQLALLNMYVECPAMATFYPNLYRKPANLFRDEERRYVA